MLLELENASRLPGDLIKTQILKVGLVRDLSICISNKFPAHGDAADLWTLGVARGRTPPISNFL